MHWARAGCFQSYCDIIPPFFVTNMYLYLYRVVTQEENKLSQLNVRIAKEDKALVEKVSQARGEHISTFVRRAVRRELATLGYLTTDERKALGF